MGSKVRKGVGINAHLLSEHQSYRRAGIHHYIQQLLNNIPPISEDLELVAFTNSVDELVDWPQNQILKSSWRTDHPVWRIAWEQFVWPVINKKQRFDLIHSMAFVTPIVETKPAVVTVYDLSFLYYPEQFPTLRRNYLQRMTQISCSKARRVIAISEFGKNDIHKRFGISLQQIDVVPPGVDATFRPLAVNKVEAFRKNNHLPERFLLHVGTLQPRKNIPVLLEAFADIRRPEVALMLIGGKGWYYDQIFAKVNELGLGSKVRFVGYVPDGDLSLWYNAAEALVFPSLYEGFGMPALEAMACGTPVIAANTSSLPEVVSDAGRLFDPQDPLALADHIEAVLDGGENVATMRRKGLMRSTNYTWIESGQKLLSVYRKALHCS